MAERWQRELMEVHSSLERFRRRTIHTLTMFHASDWVLVEKISTLRNRGKTVWQKCKRKRLSRRRHRSKRITSVRSNGYTRSSKWFYHDHAKTAFGKRTVSCVVSRQLCIGNMVPGFDSCCYLEYDANYTNRKRVSGLARSQTQYRVPAQAG